jgi:hypothetical protein
VNAGGRRPAAPGGAAPLPPPQMSLSTQHANVRESGDPVASRTRARSSRDSPAGSDAEAAPLRRETRAPAAEEARDYSHSLPGADEDGAAPSESGKEWRGDAPAADDAQPSKPASRRPLWGRVAMLVIPTFILVFTVLQLSGAFSARSVMPQSGSPQRGDGQAQTTAGPCLPSDPVLSAADAVPACPQQETPSVVYACVEGVRMHYYCTGSQAESPDDAEKPEAGEPGAPAEEQETSDEERETKRWN